MSKNGSSQRGIELKLFKNMFCLNQGNSTKAEIQIVYIDLSTAIQIYFVVYLCNEINIKFYFCKVNNTGKNRIGGRVLCHKYPEKSTQQESEKEKEKNTHQSVIRLSYEVVVRLKFHKLACWHMFVLIYRFLHNHFLLENTKEQWRLIY